MAAPMLTIFSLGRFMQKARILRQISLTERTVVGCRRCFSDHGEKGNGIDEEENLGFLPPIKQKSHPETPARGMFEINPPKGKIYDKKPIKVSLFGGKKYYWCTCGHSKHQPFCDGTHKQHYLTMKRYRPDFAERFNPHMFRVDEDKSVWLCNCKQTNKRPFCDGAHKQDSVQEKKI